MKNCDNCDTHDSMYKTASGKNRCWKCGHTEKRENNIRERPCRPDNADCGDILVREQESGDTETIARKGMNHDGSNCSGKPVGMKKVDGNYVVVCSRHRD